MNMTVQMAIDYLSDADKRTINRRKTIVVFNGDETPQSLEDFLYEVLINVAVVPVTTEELTILEDLNIGDQMRFSIFPVKRIA